LTLAKVVNGIVHICGICIEIFILCINVELSCFSNLRSPTNRRSKDILLAIESFISTEYLDWNTDVGSLSKVTHASMLNIDDQGIPDLDYLTKERGCEILQHWHVFLLDIFLETFWEFIIFHCIDIFEWDVDLQVSDSFSLWLDVKIIALGLIDILL